MSNSFRIVPYREQPELGKRGVAPEALGYADAVAILNKTLGKTSAYVSVSDEDAIRAMTEMEFPEFLINLMINLNQCIREGLSEEITTTIKDVTGNDPITFEQFVQNNKQAWLAAVA